jgi:flavin-dependent dehydrogenase
LRGRTVDVLIAGGGPGGCACALALRAHAPGLRVALAEPSDYAQPRIGETLSPAAQRVLRHLGVWDAFRAQNHAEAYATAAAWGAPVPHENDFLFSARGVGWHLDRAAFDAMLAREAESGGVTVLRARVESVDRPGGEVAGAAVESRQRPSVDSGERRRAGSAHRDAADNGDGRDGGWTAMLSTGDVVHARLIVDATGSKAAIARRMGARSVAVDRLAGFVRFFRASGGDPRTLVEAFEDGWWYTAPLPGGGRVAACMTDSDIGRELGVAEVGGWDALLAAAPRVREAVAGAAPDGGIVVRAARSRRLDPTAGDDWLAVGDAACTFDPLSSQGVLKALRSGIFAAYAAGDLLANGDASGMERYRRFVAGEFAGYLEIRARYYAEEQRWPERPFWRRRHAGVGSEPMAATA